MIICEDVYNEYFNGIKIQHIDHGCCSVHGRSVG